MQTERLIREAYIATSSKKEEREALQTFADILRDSGFFVAEGKEELSELAQEECGLVEPE